MLKIVKASAGSGKTFLLAHTYIDLLLDSPDNDAYRHILAVTFTNKATDEMKERILKELFKISCEKDNVKAARAGKLLHAILHDYSNFAVSTIDSFFQQTLRAFAHETGHYSSSQVELAKDALIDEAVDGILDSLDEEDKDDSQLLDFITESMEEEVDSGKKIDIDGALKSMARELRSEELWLKSKSLGLDISKEYTPEKLKELRKRLNEYRRTFENEIRDRASAIVRAAADNGWTVESFARGEKGWFAYYPKMAALKEGSPVFGPTDAARAGALNPESWFKKADLHLVPAARTAMGGLIDGYYEYFDKHFRVYQTSSQILRNIYGLGIAQRLDKAFEAVTSSRNVICLDESNRLLREIIDGSDTPFVYEKTGTRIGNYLLDEFQDTSVTQWDNFKPLLEDALSTKAQHGDKTSNLIVGDVKQSIYRWRESDWGLLDHEVQNCFPKAETSSKQENWRSFEQVVKFNNEFYPHLAAALDANFGGGSAISDIYGDVTQTIAKSGHAGKGFVELKFCDDVDAQLDAILQTVLREREEHNARAGQIAILVRTNKKGSMVAAKLIEAGINVETEASFALKSSVSVRRLASMLSYVNDPKDELNSYVARSLGIETELVPYHNLTGLCDSLYSILENNECLREDCRKEVVFVTAFMDFVRDYAARNGDNLGNFLKYWDEQNPSVSSALSSDAVKILTIHKSKGLAFPYVIVPFVEDIELFNSRSTFKWCRPELEGSCLEDQSDKLFRVKLTSAIENTAFATDYLAERFNQSVDAINMLYVATTRAQCGMTLISRRGTPGKLNSMNGILFDFARCADVSYGDGPDFRALEKDNDDALPSVPCRMEYGVMPVGARLRVRPYAADYFGPANNDTDDFLKRGVVYHDILSRVTVPSDLPDAICRSIDEGLLDSAAYDKTLAFLGKAVASHPEFFPTDADGHLPEGYTVRNEFSIIGRDGHEKRPDRVIIAPDGKLTIVDYKFGSENEEYLRQIDNYKALMTGMGYDRVEAKLWFVYKNYVI